MKKGKLITYWIATALLSVGMLGSGIAQLLHAEQMVEIFTHLGFPLYLMTILGVWKILAVVAILAPRFPLVKEWAYAGLFFTMTGALVSHLAVGDTQAQAILGPVFQSIFVVLSWYFRPANRRIFPVNA
jgi:uncharacterized membrane protein